MQLYTVYLYLESALHVSGGISTHHQELISQYLALLRPKMSHPRYVYIINKCGYQSITQQYLKKMFNKG